MELPDAVRWWLDVGEVPSLTKVLFDGDAWCTELHLLGEDAHNMKLVKGNFSSAAVDVEQADGRKMR